MSIFRFELKDGGQVSVLEGSSRSRAEAEDEAVLFLGEVLRDRPEIGKGPISVTVMEDDKACFAAQVNFVRLAK